MSTTQDEIHNICYLIRICQKPEYAAHNEEEDISIESNVELTSDQWTWWEAGKNWKELGEEKL